MERDQKKFEAAAHRDLLLETIGDKIAALVISGYGKIEFNFADGQYVGANVMESIKARKRLPV